MLVDWEWLVRRASCTNNGVRRPIERHVSNGNVTHEISMRLCVAVESKCVTNLCVVERTEDGWMVTVGEIGGIETTLINLVFNVMATKLWVIISVDVVFEMV